MIDRAKIKNIVDDLDKRIESVKDPEIKEIQKTLLNLVELLLSEIDQQNVIIQQQKNEINRLKGELGKPKIRGSKKDDDNNNTPNNNHSSENERKRKNENKEKKSKEKKSKITVNRTVTCKIEPSTLPQDVVFKGYESVVIQDVVIKTDNIQFNKKVFYSPSLKKTFTAELPMGYHGEFGPSVRALVLSLYNSADMTQSAIEGFLSTIGIRISKATISRMLIDDHDLFHQEKEDIITAGFKSTGHQHTDDTSGRVNGKNQHVHILCNQYYTAYCTLPKKDRLSILKVLSRGELMFSLEEMSFQLMISLGLSEKYLPFLQKTQGDFTEEKMDEILRALFPNPKKQKTNRRLVKEAAAIIAYRKRDDAISQLVVDDAPQFKRIIDEIALCWIHEGRHYKKLDPVLTTHRKLLDSFIGKFWDYYHELLDYQEKPTKRACKKLERKFDNLFSTQTGYAMLDERIAKTLEKKQGLLLVLKYPHIPLHNNVAELAARFQARKRDIHLYTKNAKGTRAKDTFATIVQTAKKLSVNIYQYLHDRISKKYAMPSLAEMILERASLNRVSASP